MSKFLVNTKFLSVVELSKSFDNKRVLEKVSLDIAKGESISILGKSGVGKSVFFKCVIGLLNPDSGKVYFRNNLITDSTEIRRHCAYLFQEPALFDSMTVFDNVAFPLREVLKVRDKTRVADRVEELLEWVGLSGTGSQLPHELSGGMQKRASFARTLAMNPDIMLFDEPTTGLDPITGDVIIQLIHRANKSLGITCITITHNLQQSLLHSDRIIMLSDGHFEVIDNPENFVKNTNESIQSFLAYSKMNIQEA